MVVLEAVGRLVPGVMGNERVGRARSPSPTGLLEYPQYTRPADVPGLGGARGAALRRPRPRRPLAAGPGAGPHARATAPTSSRPEAGLTDDEARLLDEFGLGAAGGQSLSWSVPAPVATPTGAACAMNPTDLVDQRAACATTSPTSRPATR